MKTRGVIYDAGTVRAGGEPDTEGYFDASG
jgi:hypothetical protein